MKPILMTSADCAYEARPESVNAPAPATALTKLRRETAGFVVSVIADLVFLRLSIVVPPCSMYSAPIRAQLNPGQFRWSPGAVDRYQALVSIDSNLIAILDRLRRQPRSNYARHSILAAHHRSVGKRAPAVAYTGGNFGEGGCPCRSGTHADQDVALLQPRQLVRRTQHPRDATRDSRRCRHARQLREVGATGSHSFEEFVGDAENFNHYRLSDRFRRRTKHDGHFLNSLVPFIEISFAVADDRFEGFAALLAGRERTQLGIEQKIHIIWIGEVDRSGDRLRRFADRNGAAHVDVPIMVIVPPRKICVLAGSERLIERTTFLGAHLAARLLDQALAFCDRRVQAAFEGIGIIALQKRLDDAKAAIRIFDPGRRTDIDNAVTAPAVFLQERIERRDPLGCRRVLLERLVNAAGRRIGDDFCCHSAASGVGKLPHRAVRFHRLGFVTLQKLRNVGRGNAQFLAQAVKPEIVRGQRIHQVEMDFPGAHVKRARIDHELPDFRRRLARQIVSFQIAQTFDDFVAAFVPDSGKILQKRGQYRADAFAAVAGNPRGDRNIRAVDKDSSYARRQPVARRQRHIVRRRLRAPREAVLEPDKIEGISTRPLKPFKPKPRLVFRLEQRELITHPGSIDVLARIEAWIALVLEDLCEGDHAFPPFAAVFTPRGAYLALWPRLPQAA